MKHFALFLLLVPLWQGFAQSPPVGAFHIGLNAFAPEWDQSAVSSHFVEGFTANPSTPDERLHHLSRVQFDSARALGLNLASIVVDHSFVLPERLYSRPFARAFHSSIA